MENSNDYQAYLFHQGTNTHAYEFLGAHEVRSGDGYSCTFRTWAPRAAAVALTSDRTGWETGAPMVRATDAGLWEITLTGGESFAGVRYKYLVTAKSGSRVFKNDPYAFASERGGGRASVVGVPGKAEWRDGGWMRWRRSIAVRSGVTGHFYPAPLSVYEVHPGSFITKDGAPTRDGEHYESYGALARALACRAKRLGFTHVELLPIMEHPFDGSWGYQITGYFCPTARFGAPADFAELVDTLHGAGVGVILDWVPAHFPKDSCGLSDFDGLPEYEYQGADRMENRGWGTRFFDVGRPEVQSFLISNALFWMREYHVDGLRADAVASMLYLDYDRSPGEWVPGEYGDNRNTEAVAFFKKLNRAVFAEYPDALMIAEESTAWEGVTRPADAGGLGFNFKWNMGWANDMFSYVAADPAARGALHGKLTFPLCYAFSENFILPVSHDEVVHGKRSLIDKIFGGYDDKFATLRSFFLFMAASPGKKLVFMGCEFAQFREWDFESQLEWFMRDYPRHRETEEFVAELGRVYLGTPALWEIDDGWDGFSWIDPDDRDGAAVSFFRRSLSGGRVAVAVNFSGLSKSGIAIPFSRPGEYRAIISTDDVRFGGEGRTAEIYPTRDGVLSVSLPPFSAIIIGGNDV